MSKEFSQGTSNMGSILAPLLYLWAFQLLWAWEFSQVPNTAPDIPKTRRQYGADLLKREMSLLYQQESTDNRPFRRSNSDEIADLQMTMRVMDGLELNFPRLASLSKPTLWHTDLHMGNIFVSNEDPTKIVSIIDWQFISVGPMFLQVTWPEFLKPTQEYTLGVVEPKLPDGFDQLDAEEQAAATATQKDAILTKSYELRSLRQSPNIYHSLNLPPVFRELFVRCGEANTKGTLAIRACLYELVQTWNNTPGLIEGCPVSFTTEQLLEIEREYREYCDWHEVQDFARDYLNTDVDGWISPEFDFKEVRRLNKTILERYMAEMSKHSISQDAARRKWPFPEGL
jgi:hypothetical protein